MAVRGGGSGGAPRPHRTAGKPTGVITRGTTNPNRLRRVDRWIAAEHARLLRAADDPLVVDLGYGASPVTTLEFLRRLRGVRPDVEMVGIEIDPERVAAARPYEEPGLSFVRGGFEVPVPGRRPALVRAFNVLRQYGEDDVAHAWSVMCARLAPGGLLVEGTCDEPGRLAAWLAVGPDARPRSLTLAARLAALERPSALAERLPKALIHRNVPGEPVHAFLAAFDRAWDTYAPLGALGARQRWAAAVAALAADWPVRTTPSRARGGEVTVDWAAVAPRG
ncbi:class I SAM-dependent methyltransferase [Yinghuangia seranimata]|uniref:class I SAM-dependent methyltransferase n=1 Tax=Yinghuangia seranimata TaxID=408067 RepID=UPI00248C0DE8|nr:class I SAM-dependent methyltransferase [Yinghuangia seranimata]MDI2131771.1 class I SAM-dependent methyltransferase [Yinghuangia seranimata]